ncbi:hypothetical protein DL96DRAFT_1821637 [Flagelloscypha sp. PMI_526]|nr:hypothetical protein DL96DRAFT_1821637 [Flagelloscypha sp. PMI_526]
MRPSHSKDIKSFFGTLVAHGHPRAQSQINQSTLQPASNIDTGLNATGTVLQLAKDAGDAASKVPYVKAVAGILSQIIKIRDEIQANKERCDEIIDLVHSKTVIILESLDIVYRSNGADEFEDLSSDLEAYADFLRGVLRDDLEPWKAQSRWISYVNRGKKASDMQKLERQLDHFEHRFSVKRLVAISVDARNTFTLLSKSPLPTEIIPQALPESPEVVIGREDVVENVVQAVLSSSKPRVVLLGPGGIGKTTIGTTMLHDSRITSAYPTRYFVSVELAPTTELLETRIADALTIPQSERGVDLVSQIVDNICRNPHPILLCIDNLETVWEVENEQPQVDHFLDILSGVGNKLAILVTMRGTQEPKTSCVWDSILILGLDTPRSITMFERLSREPADAFARELLLKLSGSPLAIKLFALMVKEGDKPSQVLSSWNEHGVKILETGGKHRLSNLEQSIHLSVFSPRIDDNGRLVLGLIALMPDGLSTSSPWIEGFESALPNKAPLRLTLRALRRMALVDENRDSSRWQMLPPIREFCLRLIDSISSVMISLVEVYIKTLAGHWNYSSSASQRVILPEMVNIRGLLLYAAHRELLLPSIGHASAKYADWARWRNIDDSAILASFLRLSIPFGEQADIHLSMGNTHTRWDRLEAAEASLTRALELFCEARNRLGEAKTHQSIGVLHVLRDRLDAADASFSCALELYNEVRDQLGEANTHKSIGDLHMRRHRLDAAEASFGRALELYREVQDRQGEANIHQSIGDLHVLQDRPDAAEASFTYALGLYREIKSRMGEADTYHSIGDLHVRRDRLEAAEASFCRALEIYREIQNRLGEADTHQSLGDLHVKRNRLDAAEVSFTHALELYREGQSRLGEAKTQKSIGDLHLCQDRLDAAEASFTRALDLYREAQDQLGEANTHCSFGDLHLRLHRTEAAGVSFRHALELYREVQSRRGEENIHHSVGDYQVCRDRLHEAGTSFAMERLGEAVTRKSIDDLDLQSNQLDGAHLCPRVQVGALYL